MAFIHARQRWKRQPTGRLEIDWGNCLTNGLIAAVLPGPVASLMNIVDQSAFTVTTNNAASAYTAGGKSFVHNATNSAYTVTIPTITVANSRFSIGCHSAWNEGDQTICALGPGAVADMITGWPNVAQFKMFGAGNLAIAAATGAEAGKSFIGGYDGTNSWILTRDSSASIADAVLDSDVTQLTIVLGWDTQGITPRTQLIAVWRNSLFGPAGKEFCKNPWQLFRPLSKRIYVNVVAGGAPDVKRIAVQNISQAVNLASTY